VKGCFHERSVNRVSSIGGIPADPTLQFSWIVLDWKIHRVIAFTINPTLIEERNQRMEGSKLLQNKLAVSTEYMPVYTFTADFLSWMRGHLLVHTLTSEHIRCATALFRGPACARPARLHPAGPPAPCGGRTAHSNAAHSLQQQDTLGQEQISVLLCWQLQGSPKAAALSAVAEPLATLAAPASGSELDSYVVWHQQVALCVNCTNLRKPT